MRVEFEVSTFLMPLSQCHRLPLAAALAGVAAGNLACSLLLGTPEPVPPVVDVEVLRRAESERAEALDREVKRLRADLQRAEGALVAVESGLRGQHTRASAVSSLAEARIQVERAAAEAPWRAGEIGEARGKLEVAERHIADGYFGAALFFVYRAQRIAETVEAEADQVQRTPETRYVRGRRVNLRAGPSTDNAVLSVLTRGTPVFPEGHDHDWVLVRTARGRVGWIHDSLIARR
ncbi:MAG: SH3 domain-containing protein [Proteobacteria bacterium]|nr:SH3 domain-containing protein [Pseudomonadota bacterium]